MKIKKTLLLFFLTAFGSMFVLSGCSLFTHPKKITVKIPKKFKYALNNVNFKIKNDWWKNFKSNELDNLVSKALKNNLNYIIAIKNIQVAKTYVSQNESNLFPTVNFSYEATRNKMGYETSIFSGGSSSGSSPTIIYNLNQAGLSTSYELDVWNQVNNAVKQAKANVSVSKEDADVVKLTLISNVAQAYFQIQALKESIVNLKKEYKAEKEILKLYEVQYKDGLINAEPIVNTKTNLEILRTELNDSIKQKDITQNTLAYYLGKFPENFKLSVKTNIKNVLNFNDNRYFKLIPPNIPSEILTQRPDVKEAEYNVLAYAYAKKESLANFFPVFNLTGNYGYASPSLNNFITDANSVWNFGLDILAPIFNYKTNISIYKRSKLQYQQAVLNYRNTIINAFSETDSDLADFQKDMQTLKSYEKNYHYALKLFNIYKVQYKTGISSKITYLTYKENLLNSEYNLINQNLLVKEDVINVYNALGMGLKD
ncbi:MAG: TolC family protein [Candidatus Acidulodesulfobacterium acidiphilum]|uniref:TolC family protein n=1 Tax=Candidatus Acidulodesulfobacterium acidiphilum TaxID=2597224 RepID=A0A520XDA6_9DELT|nr:MAG: TolC family protein [Candidatus Acidulodesulfobacterium acidiphilum]